MRINHVRFIVYPDMSFYFVLFASVVMDSKSHINIICITNLKYYTFKALRNKTKIQKSWSIPISVSYLELNDLFFGEAEFHLTFYPKAQGIP